MAVLSSSSSEYSEKITRCTTTTSSSSSSSRCCRTGSLIQVPEEILELVLERLGNSNVWDFFRFGAVCRTFHRVKKKSSYNGLPLIAIQHYMDSDRAFPVECFGLLNYPYKSTSTSSSQQIKKEFLPRVDQIMCETSDQRMFVFGSSHGWLLLCPNRWFNTFFPSILLLDPLSGHRRSLPYPISHDTKTHECSGMRKMIFSSSPNSLSCPNNNNVIVVALQPTDSHSLAFARLGVNSALIGHWTLFEESSNQRPTYEDIIFWNGVLYGITKPGSDLIAFDLNDIATPKPRPIRVATSPSFPHQKDKDIIQHKFLAKLHDDLLLVSLSWKENKRGKWLQIDKLDNSTAPTPTPTTNTWTRVRSLDGGALFICRGSESISRFAFSNQYSMKKNCVYFLWPPTLYVFNLDEGSVVHQDYRCLPKASSFLWLDLVRC